MTATTQLLLSPATRKAVGKMLLANASWQQFSRSIGMLVTNEAGVPAHAAGGEQPRMAAHARARFAASTVGSCAQACCRIFQRGPQGTGGHGRGKRGAVWAVAHPAAHAVWAVAHLAALITPGALCYPAPAREYLTLVSWLVETYPHKVCVMHKHRAFRTGLLYYPSAHITTAGKGNRASRSRGVRIGMPAHACSTRPLR